MLSTILGLQYLIATTVDAVTSGHRQYIVSIRSFIMLHLHMASAPDQYPLDTSISFHPLHFPALDSCVSTHADHSAFSSPPHTIDALLMRTPYTDSLPRLLHAPDKDVSIQRSAHGFLATPVPVNTRHTSCVRTPACDHGFRVVGFVDDDFSRGESNGEIMV